MCTLKLGRVLLWPLTVSGLLPLTVSGLFPQGRSWNRDKPLQRPRQGLDPRAPPREGRLAAQVSPFHLLHRARSPPAVPRACFPAPPRALTPQCGFEQE